MHIQLISQLLHKLINLDEGKKLKYERQSPEDSHPVIVVAEHSYNSSFLSNPTLQFSVQAYLSTLI